MTAVSVRRMNRPSEPSRNPQRWADSNSASVQPPSGPIAIVAIVAGRPSRTLRSSLGKHHAQTIFARSENAICLCHFAQHRHADAPGLLRGFQQNFLPALRPLRCRCEQGLLASLRSEWHNRAHAQLRGLFNRPFERVKLHHGQQQRDIHAGLNGGQLLDERELHVIAAHTFDPTEPYSFAVAQLIELAGLGAQHASEVMRRFAFHDGGLTGELFNKKSSSHREILSQEDCSYPKMSFTLSKTEELRSAGLFSTFIVAPSCSINFRWSRVSFVGVSTRT